MERKFHMCQVCWEAAELDQREFLCPMSMVLADVRSHVELHSPDLRDHEWWSLREYRQKVKQQVLLFFPSVGGVEVLSFSWCRVFLDLVVSSGWCRSSLVFPV